MAELTPAPPTPEGLDPMLYHFLFLSGVYTNDHTIKMVSCGGETTIAELKELVVRSVPKGAPPISAASSVRLIFQGMELQPEPTVASCKFLAGTITRLHLAVRLSESDLQKSKPIESRDSDCGCTLL